MSISEKLKQKLELVTRRLARAFSHKQAPDPPELLRVSKSDVNLYPMLLDYLIRNFQNIDQKVRASGKSSFPNVRVDGDASWIPDMLARTDPHDKDYHIFRSFKDNNQLILDIGANWGYSVGSLWSTGCRCHVVSFEAIPLYKECLDAIKRIRPNDYDYFITALSSRPMTCDFVIPTVNGIALTALTSASKEPHLPSMARNIFDYIHQWMPNINQIEFSLCAFEVPVSPLDDVISENPHVFSDRTVAAIKIDVEGLEFEVISGARCLLTAQTPMVMTEGGNRRANLQDFMVSLGYCYAERDQDKLVFVDEVGTASNGFFLHKSKLSTYREAGIL